MQGLMCISKPRRQLELIEIISVYCNVQSFQCVAPDWGDWDHICLSLHPIIYTVVEVIEVIILILITSIFTTHIDW